MLTVIWQVALDNGPRTTAAWSFLQYLSLARVDRREKERNIIYYLNFSIFVFALVNTIKYLSKLAYFVAEAIMEYL